MIEKQKVLRKLLRVGELAKRAGVLPSTIRFYTQKGLITVEERTKGGNCLYDAASCLARISLIRQMHGSRPSLEAVGEKLDKAKL